MFKTQGLAAKTMKKSKVQRNRTQKTCTSNRKKKSGNKKFAVVKTAELPQDPWQCLRSKFGGKISPQEELQLLLEKHKPATTPYRKVFLTLPMTDEQETIHSQIDKQLRTAPSNDVTHTHEQNSGIALTIASDGIRPETAPVLENPQELLSATASAAAAALAVSVSWA